MPHVHLTTPTGPVELHYNISTPTTDASPSINPEFPCIIFLHAGYIAQEVFEAQFADPQLRRRFNLIVLDMRAFGSTKGAIVSETYTPSDSADDVYRFIQALKLPPLHLFGLSIGSSVALEFTASHPDHVLSLTLCSPLPQTEPEDVAAGRLEVYRYWTQSFDHNGERAPTSPLEGDHAWLGDVVHGAQQLCFNNESTRLTEALTENALLQAIKNRAGSPTKLANSYKVSVSWFLDRRPFSQASLSKIKCPIRLIHCSEDIAYPLRHVQEIKAQLRQAGVSDVVLCQVSGPHYGNVLNPQAINPILRDVVLLASRKMSRASHKAPQNDYDFSWMTTPFTFRLAKYGYDPRGNESDSE